MFSVVSKQVKNVVALLAFFDLQKLPATRITEQPALLTKSKVNRPCYEFLKYFR